MRKKELKKRLEELETQEWERQKVETAANSKWEAYHAWELAKTVTAYTSAESTYEGIIAVLKKLNELDPNPTSLTVTAQYIPAGADGEPSYYATTGTTST
jgi:hypothetical protein